MLSSTHLSLSASRIVTTSTHLSLSSVAPQVEYLECPKVLEYSGLMAVSAKDRGGRVLGRLVPGLLTCHIVGAGSSTMSSFFSPPSLALLARATCPLLLWH